MTKTIYDLLKNDHDKHRKLMDEISDTSGDSEARQKAWKEFFYEVSAHAAAEEEAFYGPLIKTEDGQPHARHSVAEHHEVDEMMAELNETDMSSPGWLTKFKTMRHRYEHHIDEEEEDIFPAAKEALGKDAHGKYGQEFMRRNDRARELVDEKTDAAPDE